jgi:hypothetical protein
MANYQLPLTAYVGSFEPSPSLIETLEVALNSRKRSSSFRPEHARRHFLTSFARQSLSDAALQPLADLIIQARKDQKLLHRLGVKSWNYELECNLLSQSTFRLAFLRWLHDYDVLKVKGHSRDTLHRYAQVMKEHSKRLELQQAVQALQITNQQAS